MLIFFQTPGARHSEMVFLPSRMGYKEERACCVEGQKK